MKESITEVLQVYTTHKLCQCSALSLSMQQP